MELGRPNRAVKPITRAVKCDRTVVTAAWTGGGGAASAGGGEGRGGERLPGSSEVNMRFH